MTQLLRLRGLGLRREDAEHRERLVDRALVPGGCAALDRGTKVALALLDGRRGLRGLRGLRLERTYPLRQVRDLLAQLTQLRQKLRALFLDLHSSNPRSGGGS